MPVLDQGMQEEQAVLQEAKVKRLVNASNRACLGHYSHGVARQVAIVGNPLPEEALKAAPAPHHIPHQRLRLLLKDRWCASLLIGRGSQLHVHMYSMCTCYVPVCTARRLARCSICLTVCGLWHVQPMTANLMPHPIIWRPHAGAQHPVLAG